VTAKYIHLLVAIMDEIMTNAMMRNTHSKQNRLTKGKPIKILQ